MKKRILYFTFSIVFISFALYLFSFQIEQSFDQSKLQSEINDINKVSASLSILNKSMGRLEKEPQKENFNKVKTDFEKLKRSDFKDYEPWFPEKKIVLLDSLDLLFKSIETFNSVEIATSSKEFKNFRIKLLETEIYYSKLLKYNLDKSITDIESEARLNQDFRILNLLSGILLSLGILTLYLGIRKIKTTRPNPLEIKHGSVASS